MAACVSAAVWTAPRVEAAHADRLPPGRQLRWLTLGDSYSSGEGASGADGHCQRSRKASGPKAADILRRERGWNIDDRPFAACTGDLAADALNSRDELQTARSTVYDNSPIPKRHPAGSEVANSQSLAAWAAAQAPNTKFDVIVASLGGNDIGFADVVTGCTDIVRRLGHGANAVLPSITGSPWEAFVRTVAAPKLIDAKDPPGCGSVIGGELERRVDRLTSEARLPKPGGGSEHLLDVYRDLAGRLLAPGGVFVVMGYPRLIVPSQDWGRWRGDQCNLISRSDADALGRAAEHFDQVLEAKVKGLGPRFAYVSRLRVFDDQGRYHSLCGRGVEWLNTPLLFLRDGTLRKERGFHPNDLGYLAGAERVAGVVERRLGVEPTPTTTVPEVTEPDVPDTTVETEDTVESSESHFDIGDAFSATCTVAWPTAPVRGVDSIQMRTSCGGVPDQFLFVDVVYGDPDLPVTPSRSTMQVEGEIVDIARSEYGFTTLVVVASDIKLE